MSKQIKVLYVYPGMGKNWDNITVGSVHGVIDPPTAFARDYPNGENSVWVMGDGGKVRLVNLPGNKEFCYVD
jgi:hypothetical protein